MTCPTSTVRVKQQQLEVLKLPKPPTGQSPHTLVFLHEGLGSVALWRDWPAQLCQRLGCAGWVYSRRGYGQSEPIPHARGPSGFVAETGQRQGRLLPDYMHQEALEVLPALLHTWGIERPVLVGHSDGGTIALIHASHFDVAACVVMAPHVMVEDVSIQAIQAAQNAYENGPLRQRLAPFHADVDSAFWPWNDVWLSEAFRSFDIRPELRGMAAPLLAIQGESDPYGTMAQIDDIAAVVPQTQRLKLPDCGHSPHRDQPEAVAQAIADFMHKSL
ncbi:alpha/beta fold hydrolase [Limnohabitans sp. G3-2]|uniref:alpha/beta fold hydrolase n=1 Tax=Limnohabitans sp. G3-2 TaxID=1100711 RepID=UPI000C1EAEEC|nr:alpha/beta hydrolase [Limnohabitans sp. G3-2]PIT78008.1 alpha/beta hydrolase [Limnohabitans sp. G3-2]